MTTGLSELAMSSSKTYSDGQVLFEEGFLVVKHNAVVYGSQVRRRDVHLRCYYVAEGRAQVANGFAMNRASEPADDVVDAVHVVSQNDAVGFHQLKRSNQPIMSGQALFTNGQ